MHSSMVDKPDRVALKAVSPIEMLSVISRNENMRDRLIKQLEQLEIDTTELISLPLNELFLKVEDVMRNTYSVKYLGLNKNEMGIISRRINPFADCSSKLAQMTETPYTVNKYFYPKPLKVKHRPPGTAKINVNNLESEIKKAFDKKQKEIQSSSNGGHLKKSIAGGWISIARMLNQVGNKRQVQKENIGKHFYPEFSITEKHPFRRSLAP